MQRIWLGKAAIVIALLLILKFVLVSIDGVVGERATRQQQVVHEIASSNYGPQIYSGLVLIVPYVEEYDVRNDDKTVHRVRNESVIRVFPATADIKGDVAVSTKARGLFKARVFDWLGTAEGEFVLNGLKVQRVNPDSQIIWGTPFVSLALSDPRGLMGSPSLHWNGRAAVFEKGSGLASVASGLHAKLPGFDGDKPQRFAYSLKLALRGTQSMSILPLADDNRVAMKSPWPHPSFGGQFLPNADSQQVSKDGFSAQWNISAFASSAQQQFTERSDGIQRADRLEVRFIEPIDIYSLSDRALKYGFLFILLTFSCFLVFEVLKRLSIHPAQYLMVGLALATFFLLLVALSEHIAFWMAYAIASAACIALLGVYLSAVLAGTLRGLSFAALLTILYGALYGLLISEDNALLMGALLVFSILALAMLATRKVDWYALTQRPPLDGGQA